MGFLPPSRTSQICLLGPSWRPRSKPSLTRGQRSHLAPLLLLTHRLLPADQRVIRARSARPCLGHLAPQQGGSPRWRTSSNGLSTISKLSFPCLASASREVLAQSRPHGFFKIKPTRLKARCVASQLTSPYQVADTYNPTASLSALRFFMDFAVAHGCTVTTLDVVGACLFAKFESDDEICLRVPPRMHDVVDFVGEDGNPAEFIKLTRYLYGLRRDLLPPTATATSVATTRPL